MPVANDFESWQLRLRHYVDHGSDFGAKNSTDYCLRAKTFLNKPVTLGGDIEENQRRRGGVLVEEWVRYDKITNEFAVVYTDGVICTYFKPMMASHAPPGTPRRKTHRRASNYQYFLDECNLP